MYPGQAEDIDTLVKYADMAMYQVKHKFERSTYKVYGEEIHDMTQVDELGLSES